MKYYAWPQCFPQETERKVMFIFKCFNLLHFETEIKRLDLRRTFCFCKQFNHEHIQDFPRFLEGFRCCCCGQITSYPEEVLWRKTVKIYYHHNIYKKKKHTCRMQFSTLHSVMWNSYAQWWSNCNLLKYNYIRIAKKTFGERGEVDEGIRIGIIQPAVGFGVSWIVSFISSVLLFARFFINALTGRELSA